MAYLLLQIPCRGRNEVPENDRVNEFVYEVGDLSVPLFSDEVLIWINMCTRWFLILFDWNRLCIFLVPREQVPKPNAF